MELKATLWALVRTLPPGLPYSRCFLSLCTTSLAHFGAPASPLPLSTQFQVSESRTYIIFSGTRRLHKLGYQLSRRGSNHPRDCSSGWGMWQFCYTRVWCWDFVYARTKVSWLMNVTTLITFMVFGFLRCWLKAYSDLFTVINFYRYSFLFYSRPKTDFFRPPRSSLSYLQLRSFVTVHENKRQLVIWLTLEGRIEWLTE